jgi:hypothetical protein
VSSARTKRPPCGSTGSRVHTSELSAEPCRNREARIGSAIPPFRRFSDPGFGCGTPLTLMVDAAEPAGIIVGAPSGSASPRLRQGNQRSSCFRSHQAHCRFRIARLVASCRASSSTT